MSGEFIEICVGKYSNVGKIKEVFHRGKSPQILEFLTRLWKQLLKLLNQITMWKNAI